MLCEFKGLLTGRGMIITSRVTRFIMTSVHDAQPSVCLKRFVCIGMEVETFSGTKSTVQNEGVRLMIVVHNPQMGFLL